MADEHASLTCFVLMPFSVKDYQRPLYSDPNHWVEVYDGLIVPAIIAAGLRPERDDDDTGTRAIGENILRKIEDADLILCDTSGHNPNVFLELGWAMRADKSYVLIKDDLTQFTFDLNQQYTFEYSHSLQPRSLKQNVADLAGVLRRTSSDSYRRYSMVRKLTISAHALESADKGDLYADLLLGIKETLASMSRSTALRPRVESGSEFPWPQLLWRGVSLLTSVVAAVEGLIPGRSPAPEEIKRLAQEMGAWKTAEIQVDIVDTNGRFAYHDWPDLIGNAASTTALDGSDPFQSIAVHEFGSVAWVDRTANVRESGWSPSARYNIALHRKLPNGLQVVVELHYARPSE